MRRPSLHPRKRLAWLPSQDFLSKNFTNRRMYRRGSSIKQNAYRRYQAIESATESRCDKQRRGVDCKIFRQNPMSLGFPLRHQVTELIGDRPRFSNASIIEEAECLSNAPCCSLDDPMCLPPHDVRALPQFPP